MKLTQRQLDKISSLISEEAEVRKNLHEGMYENRKKSVLSESLMFNESDAGSDDPRLWPETFANNIADDMTNYSRDLLVQINSKLYKSLAAYMKSNGSVAMSPAAWQDELEAFDIYEHEMELASTIANAIQDYAMRMMEAAIQSASPPTEE